MLCLGERNVILDALVNATSFYTRCGFQKTGMYQYKISGVPSPIAIDSRQSGVHVERTTEDNIDGLLSYEQTICTVKRTHFIKKWLSRGMCYYAKKAGNVCGMISAWKYGSNPPRYRLAAFYADDVPTAIALMGTVINEVSEGSSMLLYFPDANLPNVKALAEAFNISFEEVVDSNRVATKGDLVGLPLHKVFSVTYSVCDFI